MGVRAKVPEPAPARICHIPEGHLLGCIRPDGLGKASHVVGDISDEFDDEDLIYSQIDDKNFLFEGKISLKDFYRIIDVDENEFESKKGEAETLAGFLLEISGNFPKKRQKITFHNLIFTIENVDKRRIKQIKVTL
jgi:CBS domain containing-hemolysin-like protein